MTTEHHHANTPFQLPQALQEATYPLSPYTDEAEQHTRLWLKNIGLESTAHATHQQDIYSPGQYAGFMWNDAPRETLFVLSDLTGWFSCQDDLADEECEDPDALERHIRGVYDAAFVYRSRPQGPLATGLADIIRRAARLMPPQWKERVAEQYATYLKPCVTALMHRINHTQPGVEGYDSLWRSAGGFQVCVEFTYFALNIHLPSSLYYSQPWQELNTLVLNHLKAVNDLLSFPIMENPDEDIYNLLTHLRHTKGYSPERAASEVSRRIEAWTEDYTNAQRLLPERLALYGYDERSREQAQLCAQAMSNLFRGNIAWHLTVPRYREIRFKG
ncbi:hypothetical protein OOJ96_17585 [Pseudomonas sp. 15FMM2]|uniref:Uncharacterized protein n=1 Tax=Pseudomonas imrae TaxID=2992837 RepID=A0ACC7PFW0_9PSED